MSVTKSVGVAVGSYNYIELKIYYMLYALHKLSLLLMVLSRHIDHLVSARLCSV